MLRTKIVLSIITAISLWMHNGYKLSNKKASQAYAQADTLVAKAEGMLVEAEKAKALADKIGSALI